MYFAAAADVRLSKNPLGGYARRRKSRHAHLGRYHTDRHPGRQRSTPSDAQAPRLGWPKVGEGNRTLMASLDGWPHSLVMGSDLAVWVAVGSRG